MSDWDAVIIGGGPAGLTAGLYLGRGNRRTLLLEKENIGGYIVNVDMIENYPGFAAGVAGAQLAMEMKDQAIKYGLELKHGEVVRVQVSGDTKYVVCADGTMYAARVLVLTGGSVHRKLGVSGEEELRGAGVISCAFCDGGEFADRTVAVCGGGDAGITEALYLTRIASKVYLIEALPRLTATAVLRDRVLNEPKIEVRCGRKVTAVIGNDRVEALSILDVAANQRQTLKVDGLLVHIGLDPNTGFLEGTIPLDNARQVVVNERMESPIPGVLAAGDIRSNSPRQVAAAVGDGAIAGISALQYLQKLT
jgi:thioredoxin reductase (NADPH)